MRYYVYDLIDPRSGKTFYIGKGQRSRVDAHEKEARSGKQSSKCDTIRSIWADGCSVRKSIVMRFKTDAEALAFEADRVAAIGRESLTNMRDGGRGGRVKFGAALLADEAVELLRALRDWVKLGSAPAVSLGSFGVLPVAEIMERYQKRLEDIASVIGAAAVIDHGRRLGLTVRFDHGD